MKSVSIMSVSLCAILSFAITDHLLTNASEQERPKCCGQEIKAASKECGCSFGDPCKCGNACECNIHLLTNAPAKPEQVKQPVSKGRGRKAPSEETLRKRHAKALERHGYRMYYIAPSQQRMAAMPTFDCRTAFNNVLPVNDQGSCGDCYGVSAADGCSMSLILAGRLPLDASKGRLSSQCGLDYPNIFNGGCNGGDEAETIDYIKKHGMPLTSDYGPYTARPGNPHLGGMKTYKIDDWGYCDQNQQQGVAAVQSIKDAMVKFGVISVAFDAGGCDNYQWPQVMRGRGNNVDHAVLCIGWDDSKNAFLGMNQWGSNWGGPNGTFWIDYQSYSWGTEAIWMTAGGPLPPPPPVPPVPPIPPGPGPIPPPIGSLSITLSAAMPAGTYQVVPTGTKIMTPEQVQRLKSLLEEVQK